MGVGDLMGGACYFCLVTFFAARRGRRCPPLPYLEKIFSNCEDGRSGRALPFFGRCWMRRGPPRQRSPPCRVLDSLLIQVLTLRNLRGMLRAVEDQESAASRGPERAPEPSAHNDFESRESSAPSHAAGESNYSEQPANTSPGGASTGAGSERPREARGGYDRYRGGTGGGARGRGGRGGRGRRPAPPRRRSDADYDRPPREEAPRDPDDREAPIARREGDDFREETPARAYDDAPEAEEVDEVIERLPEGEGSPEAATEEFPESEREGVEREPIREREREPERDRGPARGREPYRGRERGGERGGERDRGGRERERGGRGGEERFGERNIYRVLRGQVDRIRHSLESVLRDLERVVQTLQQAEHDHQLTQQEIDSLHEQLDQLQRGGGGGGGRGGGGGGGGYDRGGGDRHRRHDDSH
jgi:hypothetical protein